MSHEFPEQQKVGVYRAIYERRDVRHFVTEALDPDIFTRIIEAAHHAPSVGYMQPWRFIHITRPEIREQLVEMVDSERHSTAEALGDRGDTFMSLKVEGIRECAEVIVVVLTDCREHYVFGRRTMPYMDLASASCAIQNMWLAARAEGIGLGWVSLFNPDALRGVIEAPDDVEPIAILCIGHVDEFLERPLLEQQGWDERRPLTEIMMSDRWNNDCSDRDMDK